MFPLVALIGARLISVTVTGVAVAVLQEELCLGSFWCIRLTPVARNPQGVRYELRTLPVSCPSLCISIHIH